MRRPHPRCVHRTQSGVKEHALGHEGGAQSPPAAVQPERGERQHGAVELAAAAEEVGELGGARRRLREHEG